MGPARRLPERWVTVGRMSRKGERVVAIVACAVLLAAAVAAALSPARAGATDSDLKHSYAFGLESSNGYSILAIAASERADGRGELVLFVSGGKGSVVYQAPATVTAARIDANLGKLGSVALDVVPTGRQRSLKTRCDTESGPTKFEPQLFQGSFEFHGEEGYTDGVSSAPKEYMRFFVDLFCGSHGSGSTSGPGLPGAQLMLHARRGAYRLSAQVNKNRPGARTRFEVDLHEEREGIFITRSRTLWLGSDAFRFERGLGSAALEPPVPFSGRATFRRDAGPANRWTGTLAIDLPGRSNVPLAGSGIEATLRPTCWHEGEDRFRC